MSNFIFIANAALGQGLSGSDRIFIELAKRWSNSGNKVEVAVWEEGHAMCLREDLNNVTYQKWFLGVFKNLPFITNYIFRILSGIYYAATKNYTIIQGQPSYIYSCSDFWQDSIPALILKARYPQAKLIGSFYLAAPNPFKGYNEAGTTKIPSIKSILYFLQQQPIYWLFKYFSDYIFVTSEPDTKRFPKQSSQERCIVVKGGVDLEKVIEWKNKLGSQQKIYDAVFLGRFHLQKGVLELIDIWKFVVDKRPDSRLILLGDGPLMNQVKDKINKNNLSNNIIIKGYLFDGQEKYQIFAQSKIAVHPAVYDSGGMAVAEAMAWDLPAVSFDLEALKTYYPQGMLKVPLNNLELFANSILTLLSDSALYKKTQEQSVSLINREWSWSSRAERILQTLSK